jgi:Putative peptidoglycan binding domain/Peptidase family M23
MNPQDIGSNCVEGQGFGQNFNPSYHAGGLLGHTGRDVNCGYGTPIGSLCDGYVYSTFPIEHPASDGYTAVFTLVETPLELFEMSYGHVSHIDCFIGQHVHKGDVLAKEGNHGTVYVGNILITLAMQAAGDQRGSHRHYQKRLLKKVRRTDPTKRYLQTAEGLYYDGFYYEILNYDNGFNGCVDWTAPLFIRLLTLLSKGYDVYLLQKALVREGFATFEPTGYFGLLTYNAVKSYQRAHDLNPVGNVGPLTRASLNKTYHQLSA